MRDLKSSTRRKNND